MRYLPDGRALRASDKLTIHLVFGSRLPSKVFTELEFAVGFIQFRVDMGAAILISSG